MQVEEASSSQQYFPYTAITYCQNIRNALFACLLLIYVHAWLPEGVVHDGINSSRDYSVCVFSHIKSLPPTGGIRHIQYEDSVALD